MIRTSVMQALGSVPLFEGLPSKDLESLAGIAVEKSFPKGGMIFSEGEEASGLYVVSSGRVKVFKLSSDGKEQILHVMGPGEPFGEVPVFEGRSFPAHAAAMEPAGVFFLPRKAFVGLIERNPALALNMLGVLSRRLREFTVLIDALSLKEVPGRLAAYLLRLSKQQGGAQEVTLDVSKAHLASRLGTIPETLSRILARMAREGFINLDGPRIELLDREGLEDLSMSGKGLS